MTSSRLLLPADRFFFELEYVETVRALHHAAHRSLRHPEDHVELGRHLAHGEIAQVPAVCCLGRGRFLLCQRGEICLVPEGLQDRAGLFLGGNHDLPRLYLFGPVKLAGVRLVVPPDFGARNGHVPVHFPRRQFFDHQVFPDVGLPLFEVNAHAREGLLDVLVLPAAEGLDPRV